MRTLLVLSIASLFLLTLLLETTPGLFISGKLAGLILPGHLTIEKIRGRISHEISFDHLLYENNELKLELKQFNLKWHLSALLKKRLVIDSLQATQADLQLKKQTTNSSATASTFTVPKLPIEILIHHATVEQFNLTLNQATYTISKFNLTANLTNLLWQITQANFHFANTDFSLSGSGQPIFPYALVTNLQFHGNQLGQKIDGLLSIGGDFSLYHWHGEMTNPVALNLNGTLRNGEELYLLNTWRQLIWPLSDNKLLKSPEGKLEISGKYPNFAALADFNTLSPLQSQWHFNAKTTEHSIQTNGVINAPDGEVQLNFAYDKGASTVIQGNLSAQIANLVSFDLPLKQLNLSASLAGNSFEEINAKANLSGLYYDNLLKTKVNYHQKELSGLINLGKNQINLTGLLTKPYSCHAQANLPEPALLHPSLKNLTTTIDAEGQLNSETDGELTLKISPGSYQLPDKKALTFRGGTMQAKLNPQGLSGQGQLIIDQYKSLAMNIILPQFKLGKGFYAKQAMEASLKLDVNSLSFLENLNLGITKAEGQLTAALTSNGTVHDPQIEGEINLLKGNVLVPSLGIILNPITVNFKSQKQVWQLNGTIASNANTLNLKGQGSLTPKTTGTLEIQGSDFPLINSDEYQIQLSPNLTINFEPEAININGSIVVPSALLKPQSFNKTVNLSDDVVYTDTKKKTAANPFHLNTDINIQMGDHVQIDVKGLKGLLTGAIQLQQQPNTALTAIGELEVKEGKYKAYGQDLDIEQGQLIFTAGPINNPGIRLRAVRRFNNASSTLSADSQVFDFNSTSLQATDVGNYTVVGVDLSGRLKSPKLSLFSEPANLSQADILSMLILGKPVKQADKAGGQLLLNAISSMNLGSSSKGTQLIQQVKQTLGVEVDVKSTAKFNQQTNQISESNSVVISKTLSNRLSVSYGFGLAQGDSNVLTLTYLLNQFFSVQINASTNANGVDILYTPTNTQKIKSTN